MVEKVTISSVLEPFLSRPFEEIHLSEISRELKQPHPTARQHLNNMEKEGVLRKKIKGRLTLYALNIEYPLTIHYLSIAEKNKLIRATGKNLILKELLSFLVSHMSEDNIVIIFGSAAKNMKDANDIDLLVTGKIAFQKNIEDLGKKINKEIHLVNVPDLRGVSTALKNEIIKNHIVIQGTEEVLTWMLMEK